MHLVNGMLYVAIQYAVQAKLYECKVPLAFLSHRHAIRMEIPPFALLSRPPMVTNTMCVIETHEHPGLLDRPVGGLTQ